MCTHQVKESRPPTPPGGRGAPRRGACHRRSRSGRRTRGPRARCRRRRRCGRRGTARRAGRSFSACLAFAALNAFPRIYTTHKNALLERKRADFEEILRHYELRALLERRDGRASGAERAARDLAEKPPVAPHARRPAALGEIFGVGAFLSLLCCAIGVTEGDDDRYYWLIFGGVAVALRVDSKPSTRLQCERIRRFRREAFCRASRTSREQSIRPKISQIDFDLTEIESSEVWLG